MHYFLEEAGRPFRFNSAVNLWIACRTYRSVTTLGRLTFPVAYLKRVV
jgi:hypothetical protein